MKYVEYDDDVDDDEFIITFCRNHVLTASMALELLLVMFLAYVPGVNSGLNMYPLK